MEQRIDGETKALRAAQLIYNAMYEESEVDSHGVRYWEGAITRLYAAHEVTTSGYSRVSKLFSMMRSTEMIYRGGGGTPSRVALLRFPSQELYDRNVKYSQAVPNSKAGRVKVELESLGAGLSGLEGKLNTVIGSISGLYRKLEDLNVRVARLEDMQQDDTTMHSPFVLSDETLPDGQEPLETFDEETFDWEVDD